MYVPKAFALDEERSLELAQSIGFGHLCVAVDGTVVSTPLPFLIEPGPAPLLRAHLARANPVVAAIGTDAAALVIIAGPDAYVSPSSYPSKAEHGRVVPTWNYVAIHLEGRAHCVEGDRDIAAMVSDLTDHHEQMLPSPWATSDAPDDFLASQRRAIIGIELRITSVIGKSKLSQNRSADDRGAVIDTLRHGGPRDHAVAEVMEP